MVGNLPAHADLAVVVVGAEVFIPGTGARQQRVVDLQLGVAKGDSGFGFAPGPQPCESWNFILYGTNRRPTR